MKLFNPFKIISESKKSPKKAPLPKQYEITDKPLPNTEIDLEALDLAAQQALAEDNPDRVQLQSFYNHFHDLHLKSQMRTAYVKVLSREWGFFDERGKLNEELTQKFEKLWFRKFNKFILQEEFYGYSLVYFILDEAGDITDCELIPRANVEPLNQNIFTDTADTAKKINYQSLVDMGLIFEIGHKKNIGLLVENLRYSTVKKYAIGDWARSGEKWSDPMLIVKSDDDDDEMAKKENAAKNFGNNSYMFVKTDDDFKLLERNNSSNAHYINKELIAMCNDENSKGVNGQTGTADQKAFVGAANVQERLLNDYTEDRMRNVEFFHSEITIPYLSETLNGGNNAFKGIQNHSFKFIEEVIEDTPATPPTTPTKTTPNQPKNTADDFFL